MLPKNTLHDKEQDVFFEKVTALIGEMVRVNPQFYNLYLLIV